MDCFAGDWEPADNRYWDFNQISPENGGSQIHQNTISFIVPAQRQNLTQKMAKKKEVLYIALYREHDHKYSCKKFRFDYHQHHDECHYCAITQCPSALPEPRKANRKMRIRQAPDSGHESCYAFSPISFVGSPVPPTKMKRTSSESMTSENGWSPARTNTYSMNGGMVYTSTQSPKTRQESCSSTSSMHEQPSFSCNEPMQQEEIHNNYLQVPSNTMISNPQRLQSWNETSMNGDPFVTANNQPQQFSIRPLQPVQLQFGTQDSSSVPENGTVPEFGDLTNEQGMLDLTADEIDNLYQSVAQDGISFAIAESSNILDISDSNNTGQSNSTLHQFSSNLFRTDSGGNQEKLTMDFPDAELIQLVRSMNIGTNQNGSTTSESRSKNIAESSDHDDQSNQEGSSEVRNKNDKRSSDNDKTDTVHNSQAISKHVKPDERGNNEDNNGIQFFVKHAQKDEEETGDKEVQQETKSTKAVNGNITNSLDKENKIKEQTDAKHNSKSILKQNTMNKEQVKRSNGNDSKIIQISVKHTENEAPKDDAKNVDEVESLNQAKDDSQNSMNELTAALKQVKLGDKTKNNQILEQKHQNERKN